MKHNKLFCVNTILLVSGLMTGCNSIMPTTGTSSISASDATGGVADERNVDTGLKALDADDYITAFNKLNAALEDPKTTKFELPIVQYNIGWMYDDGKGIEQNKVTAVKWYRIAAENGFPMAQFNLATHYLRGEGVTKNQAEGINWLHKAAANGHKGAKEVLKKNKIPAR